MLAVMLVAILSCHPSDAGVPAASAQPASPPVPELAASASWFRRLAGDLGLAAPERYVRGVVRVSTVEAHGGRTIGTVLEIAQLGDGKLLFRRFGAEAGAEGRFRRTSLRERVVEGLFDPRALALLARLTRDAELDGLAAAPPDADIENCVIEGGYVAVEIEMRDELPVSFARTRACRGSVMRAPDGIDGKISFEEVFPEDSIEAVGPMVAEMFAQAGLE